MFVMSASSGISSKAICWSVGSVDVYTRSPLTSVPDVYALASQFFILSFAYETYFTFAAKSLSSFDSITFGIINTPPAL